MVDHTKIGAAVAYFEQYREKLIKEQDFAPFRLNQVPTEFHGDEEHNKTIVRVLNKWLTTIDNTTPDTEHTITLPEQKLTHRDYLIFGGQEYTIPFTQDYSLAPPAPWQETSFEIEYPYTFYPSKLSFKFPGHAIPQKPQWSLPANIDKILWNKTSLKLTIPLNPNISCCFTGTIEVEYPDGSKPSLGMNVFFVMADGFATQVADYTSPYSVENCYFSTNFPSKPHTITFPAGSFAYDASTKVLTGQATSTIGVYDYDHFAAFNLSMSSQSEPGRYGYFSIQDWTDLHAPPLAQLISLKTTIKFSYQQVVGAPNPHLELESIKGEFLKPALATATPSRKLKFTRSSFGASFTRKFIFKRDTKLKFSPYFRPADPKSIVDEGAISLQEFKVSYLGKVAPTPINPIPIPVNPPLAPLPLTRPNIYPSLVYSSLITNIPDLRTFQHWTRKNAFHFCPFQIIGGAKFSTEAGRRGLNARVTDYSQIETIFKGEDTVSVAWEGSYQTSLGSGGEAVIKKLQIGKSYLAYVLEESLQTHFTSFTAQTTMTSLQLMKSFTCHVPYSRRNREFFENVNADAQSFVYVIPEFAQNTTLAQRDNIFRRMRVNRTYFEIQNLRIERARGQDKRFLYAEVSFRSLNSQLNKTGLALNAAVQNGLPGEAVAFPALTKQGGVELNLADRVYLPIQAVQIFINGLAGLCSLYYYGTPISEATANTLQETQGVVFERPGILALYEILPPANDVLNLKKNPASAFYVSPFEMMVAVTMSAFKDISAMFTRGITSNQMEGFIDTKKAATKKTNNPDDPLPVWNRNFGARLSSAYSDWGVFDVRGNDMFQYQVKGRFIGQKSFDWRKVAHKDFVHFLFFNSAILKTVPVLPIEQKEVTGLISGFFNFFDRILKFFTFGLAGGWRSPNITDYPKFLKFPMMIPCAIYEHYLEMFKLTATGSLFSRFGDDLYTLAKRVTTTDVEKGKPIPDLGVSIQEGFLPLDIFSHSDQNINMWLGAKDTTIALAGRFTHKITTTIYSVAGGANLVDFTCTLGDVGQIITVGGNKYVPLINEKSHLRHPNALLSDYKEKPDPSKVLGYMVHAHGGHFLGGNNIITKFYSFPKDDPGTTLREENTVWVDNFRTMSAFNNDIRLWFNFNRLGDPLFDFDKKLKYPDDLKPPNYNPHGKTPTPTPEPIYELDVDPFNFNVEVATDFLETVNKFSYNSIELIRYGVLPYPRSWGTYETNGGFQILNVITKTTNNNTSVSARNEKNSFPVKLAQEKILKVTASVYVNLRFSITIQTKFGNLTWIENLFETVDENITFEVDTKKSTFQGRVELHPIDIYYNPDDPNYSPSARFQTKRATLYKHHFGWLNMRRPGRGELIKKYDAYSLLKIVPYGTSPPTTLTFSLKWSNNQIFLNTFGLEGNDWMVIDEHTNYFTIYDWNIKGLDVRLNVVDFLVKDIKIQVQKK